MEATVRPIQNEEDYDAALAEIEALMAAAPRTSDGARLDVLVTVIEAYERRRWALEAGESKPDEAVEPA